MSIYDTLVVLDFDRTLFDTAAFHQDYLLPHIGRQFDLSTAQFPPHFTPPSEHGFFDAFQHIRTLRPEVSETTIARWAATLPPADFLLPGTATFLTHLAAQHIPHLILTVGSPQFQRFKLQLSALTATLPAHIIEDISKVQVVRAAYQNDGLFHWLMNGEEELRAKQIVLVDDRLSHLEGLPMYAQGFWLKMAAKPAERARPIPPGVQPIDSLLELLQVVE